MNEPIQLEEIHPENETFTLKSTGKSHRLRPFTLLDEAWMRQKYGEEYNDVFKKGRTGDIAVIIYRLLEDKSDFAPGEVETFDDEGNAIKVRMTGPQKFLAAVTVPEIKDLIHAFNKTIGNSNPPAPPTLVGSGEKKVDPEQEKLAGEKSMTSSLPSMDTASIKSAG